jgi:hypothetical protein
MFRLIPSLHESTLHTRSRRVSLVSAAVRHAGAAWRLEWIRS